MPRVPPTQAAFLVARIITTIHRVCQLVPVPMGLIRMPRLVSAQVARLSVQLATSQLLASLVQTLIFSIMLPV